MFGVDPGYLFEQITKRFEGRRILNSDDPIAEGTSLEYDGESRQGGSGTIYFGTIDLKKTPVEGLRQLYVPILMHTRLRPGNDQNGQFDGFRKWEEKRESTEEKVKSMKRSELLTELEDTYSRLGLGDSKLEIALRASCLPPDVNFRDQRFDFILGVRQENVCYHFAHGVVKGWNLPYVVMERMSGVVNYELVEHASTVVKLRIMKNAAKGLAHLHKLGFTHRDIKPENLLYKGDKERLDRAEFKIADFDVAKVNNVTVKDDKTTKTNTIIGTPYYMSPEQAKDSKHLTWKTDMYSLGATMYELFSGKDPVGCPNVMDLSQYDIATTLRKIPRKHKLESIATKDVQLQGIEQIIARMMEPKAAKRYKNWDGLFEDIKLVEKGETPKYAPGWVWSHVGDVFKPSKYTEREHNSHRNLRAVIGLILIGGLALGGALYKGVLGKVFESGKYVTPEVSVNSK